MSRIPIPATVDDAPHDSQATLKAVWTQLGGKLPNVFRLLSTSPATLDGYVAFSSALGKGKLDKKIRERIALAIAQVNGCDYCLAAHTFFGTHVTKLGADEIAAARNGRSSNARADAAVRFSVQVVQARGAIDVADLETLRTAGFDDAETLEIVAHVALNTFTNYINEAFKTDIDFPPVERVAA